MHQRVSGEFQELLRIRCRMAAAPILTTNFRLASVNTLVGGLLNIFAFGLSDQKNFETIGIAICMAVGVIFGFCVFSMPCRPAYNASIHRMHRHGVVHRGQKIC